MTCYYLIVEILPPNCFGGPRALKCCCSVYTENWIIYIYTTVEDHVQHFSDKISNDKDLRTQIGLWGLDQARKFSFLEEFYNLNPFPITEHSSSFPVN